MIVGAGIPSAQAQLIPSTVVSQIVGARNAALARLDEALNVIVQGFSLASEARQLAESAHGACSFHGAEHRELDAYRALFRGIDREASREAFRKHLDASTWTNLMQLTGLRELMDKEAKDSLHADLCRDVPVVDEDTVYATLATLRDEAGLIFQRGLANAFIGLDRRFKSHDGFKLGSRVILTHVFDQHGHWNWRSRVEDSLADIERVFSVLDGDRGQDNYRSVRAIKEDRGSGWSPRQSITETSFFRIKGFKNGNAHLWFLRDDLVEKANQVLADYYGEVLPDAVGSAEPAASGALSRDLAFYPTPSDTAAKIIEPNGVWVAPGARVLEPSAGEGGLILPLLKSKAARIDAIEVHAERARKLEAIGDSRLHVTVANFLRVPARDDYDLVLMNPPFCGTHWMEHVRHAWDFVKPGGVLVAILPATAEVLESAKHLAFREWASARSSFTWGGFQALPAESSAASGTRINTVTLTLGRRAL